LHEAEGEVMPLNQTILKNALQDLFEDMPPSAAECAGAMAVAYADYAETGMFGASVPVIDGDRIDAMASVLEVALEPLAGAPSVIAAGWAAAVAAFWLAVPVVGAQIGVTVGCPGASSLTGALTSVFANLANTAESCASGVASALHTATATVTANVAPPPGTVASIA
jgi:hypothetical protein